MITAGFNTKLFCHDLLCHDGEFSFLQINRTNGAYKKVPEIKVGRDTYTPYADPRAVAHHSLFLTEEPIKATQREIQKDIYRFLRKYCDYPGDYLKLDIGYVMLTWIADLLYTVGYRRAVGNYGTGKSTWLECILALSRKGFKQGATTTQAGIFHKANLIQGTQGFDENEYKSNSQLQRGVELVLNSGYSKKSSIVTRIVRGEPISYNTYGPKLIAARTRFNDLATESRCITHSSRRSKMPMPQLDNEFYEEAQVIRNKLLYWRTKQIVNLSKPLPEFRQQAFKQGVEPRLVEIYEPLTRTVPSKVQEVVMRVMLENNHLLKTHVFAEPRYAVLQSISDLIKIRKPLTMGEIASWINTKIRIDSSRWSAKGVAKNLRDMGFHIERKWDPTRRTNAYTLLLSHKSLEMLEGYCSEYDLELHLPKRNKKKQ